MKGLAIYLIVICSATILTLLFLRSSDFSWDFIQSIGIGIPYFILAMVFLRSKNKYSSTTNGLAICFLICACLAIALDTLAKYGNLVVGDQQMTVWGFWGIIAVYAVLLYLPAIIFSSVIIDRHRKHICIQKL